MRFTHRVFAVVALLASGGAHTLGIGDLHVRSALNQPFQAEVPLVISRENPSELQVRLASADAFAVMGLERSHFLTSLKFATVRRPDGSYVIDIRSHDPIREPFLSFLLEITWPQGRIVKEFTALLDPPQGALAPIAPPVLERSPVDTLERAYAVSSRIPNRYGPVQADDTLSTIAHAIGAETGLSTEQVAVALYRANPDAFLGGDINTLKIDTVLTVPSREALANLNPAEARREYRRLLHAAVTAGRNFPRRENEEKHKGSTTSRQEGETANEIKAQMQGPRVELLTPGTRDGQSTAATTPQTTQNEIALEVTESLREENEEIRARLTTLEQQISALRGLLEIKDQQIAELQARVQNPQPPAGDMQPPANAAAIGTKPLPEVASIPESRSGNRGPTPGTSDDSATTSPSAVVYEAGRRADKAGDSSWGKVWWLLAGIGSLTVAVLLARMASRRQKRLTPSYGGLSPQPTIPPPPPPSTSSLSLPLRTRAAADQKAGFRTPGEAVADGSSIEVETGFGTVDVLTEAETLLQERRLDEAERLLLEADDQTNKDDGLVKLLEIYSAQGNQDAFDALLRKLTGWKETQPERWAELARMSLKLRAKSALTADDARAVTAEATALESIPLSAGMEEILTPAPGTVAKGEKSLSENVAPLEFDLGGLNLEAFPPSTPEVEIKPAAEHRISCNAATPEEENVVGTAASLEDLLAELTARENGWSNHREKMTHEESRADGIEAIQIDSAPGQERTADLYSEITDHDPLETKLDLGKVYVDMGDDEEARGLLQEVLEQGDDRQRTEARSLLQRLDRGATGSEQTS
jgi:pilus assembly protein FimV